MYHLTLSLTEQQHRRAEAKAHELGYASPDEYLHDVVAEVLEESDLPDIDDGRSHEEILEGLKSSLRQALRGEGRPAREVLSELDAVAIA